MLIHWCSWKLCINKLHKISILVYIYMLQKTNFIPVKKFPRVFPESFQFSFFPPEFSQNRHFFHVFQGRSEPCLLHLLIPHPRVKHKCGNTKPSNYINIHCHIRVFTILSSLDIPTLHRCDLRTFKCLCFGYRTLVSLAWTPGSLAFWFGFKTKIRKHKTPQ